MPRRHTACTIRNFRILLMTFGLLRFVLNGYEVCLFLPHIHRMQILEKLDSNIMKIHRVIELLFYLYVIPYDVALGVVLFITIYKNDIRAMRTYRQLEVHVIGMNSIKVIANLITRLHLTFKNVNIDEEIDNNDYDYWIITHIILQIFSYQAVLMYTTAIEDHIKREKELEWHVNSVEV